MDILTEKGQVSLEDEQIVARWVASEFGLKYAQTPKSSPATVDAVLVNDAEIMAVVETKCRYDLASLEQFQVNYKNEWLVTWSKVNSAIGIASGLAVPFVGFLYLVRPRVLLSQRISEASGMLSTNVRLSTTRTQATINGGTALRTNAYINMDTAKIYNL